MDVEAVSFATNDSLLDLGIQANALKAFCQRHLSTSKPSTADNDYAERKKN